MFIDKVKIYIKAGNGGNGAIAFHREKYVAAGGPAGGDGGHGGNVVFRVDPGSNTLLAFRYKRKFVAPNGGDGGGEEGSHRHAAEDQGGAPSARQAMQKQNQPQRRHRATDDHRAIIGSASFHTVQVVEEAGKRHRIQQGIDGVNKIAKGMRSVRCFTIMSTHTLVSLITAMPVTA